MPSFSSKILANNIKYAKLINEKLPENLNEEQVYFQLLVRTKKSRKIMRENVALLKENLKPYLENAQSIDDNRAKMFSELALDLYSLEKQVDIGLALTIHEALLARARALNNIDGIIFHLYWTGLIYMQWSKTLFVSNAKACFSEAVSYIDRYFEIENKQTRLYFNKCIGNMYVIISQTRQLPGIDLSTVFSDFTKAVDYACDFWTNKKVRELDPDFPWEAFITNIHQNTSSWIDKLRGPLADDKELARRVYDSVKKLYKLKDVEAIADGYTWSNSRTAYLFFTARYHMGLTGLDDVIGRLRKITYDVNPDDYSYEGIYKVFHVSAVLCYYLGLSDKISREEALAEELELIERALTYYRKSPSALSRNDLNNYLVSFISSFFNSFAAKDELFETLLRVTSFSHMPTFVHSVMVGEIMKVLCEYFVENKPELLIGICGADSALSVIEKKEEILEQARLAGYAHDAGKMEYVNTVAICSRNISDLEFDIIKNHSSFGYEIFNHTGKSALLDVILGHHKWWDGSRGYPAEFDNVNSPSKFLIDMCSVADSLDTATDELGRSYRLPKSLETVMGEIHDGAGSRYSPEVAKALEDEKLVDKLRVLVSKGRKKAYHDAYKNNPEKIGASWRG